MDNNMIYSGEDRSVLMALVADILDIDAAELHEDQSLSDYEQWDSVNSLRLLVSIEKDLGVRLLVTQLESLRTIRDLLTLVSTCRGASCS